MLRENEASDEAWAKATRIGRELDRILDGQEPMRTAVARAASELRLSTRQVYNHLCRYRTERRVSSLLPRTGGARRARISPAVEEIISATLREMWLGEWTKHGGHAARFLFATVSRPSRTAALVTATR